jgi:hypothetical protein
MSEQFKCKEPGCNEQVIFEYSPVEGTLRIEHPVRLKESEVVVYLTCGKGHTHPYKVKVKK